MRLYLLRHAIAAEACTPGLAGDDSRPLTPEGRRKLRRVVTAMRAMDLSFDVILTSPVLRARQTAEVVAHELGRKRVITMDALRPEGEPGAVLKALKPHAKAASLLLVGHEPSLGEFASTLLGDHSGSFVEFKKAGLCRLELGELNPGAATLHWLLTPAQMLRMR
jgi:phosphohistidine phosphatase